MGGYNQKWLILFTGRQAYNQRGLQAGGLTCIISRLNLTYFIYLISPLYLYPYYNRSYNFTSRKIPYFNTRQLPSVRDLEITINSTHNRCVYLFM